MPDIAPLAWSRLLTCLLCGFLIGIERQLRGKPVGILHLHDLLRAGHALGNAHLGHRAVTLAVLDDAADHQQRNEQQQDQPAHGEETQQQFQ